MSRNLRITVYTILAIATVLFGWKAYSAFKERAAFLESQSRFSELADPTPQPAETAPETPPEESAVSTNLTDTPLEETATATETNETIAATESAESPAPAPQPPPPAAKPQKPKTSFVGYLGAFVVSAFLLVLLIARDVTQFIGNRAVDFVFNDDLKGVFDPEYEEAESMWANGKPLDAIQLMREYLKKHPREQYVALRIAEIYEKDLKNYLAAALEYEQVLKHKLPRERWGWAAIHLCNIYSKMGKPDQTVALLRRIADEYGDTAAAKKARKRLALYESAGDAGALGTDAIEDPNAPDLEPPPPTAAPPQKTESAPASNLPPGFRPKK